ncbi:MAG TPA: hypothetical protein EYN08_06365 [Gammaproteobacteria bacterium]|nr:hypothetical protein [Gammaproteobacteria bacterium]
MSIFKEIKELEKIITQQAGKKKAVDISGLPASKIANLEKSAGITAGKRGIFGDEMIEPEPAYISAVCEKMIRKGNSLIVLGRDRPGSRKTGYGGSGDTQAASIDIIAGPQGHEVREVNEVLEKINIDPDFMKDSSRIYISAKTDIDKNFGLCAGSIGIANAKSGIGIKADGVRIIGREGIKLITATDKLNSQGAIVDTVKGIDLIAGNDDADLQPLVKGRNLATALKELSDQINSLNGIFVGYVTSQIKFNTAVMNHYHYSPFFATPTTPAFDTLTPAGTKTLLDHLTVTLQSLVKNKTNLVGWKFNYCEPAGKKYINSILNNTN